MQASALNMTSDAEGPVTAQASAEAPPRAYRRTTSGGSSRVGGEGEATPRQVRAAGTPSLLAHHRAQALPWRARSCCALRPCPHSLFSFLLSHPRLPRQERYAYPTRGHKADYLFKPLPPAPGEEALED